jgi:hypothetical protein
MRLPRGTCELVHLSLNTFIKTPHQYNLLQYGFAPDIAKQTFPQRRQISGLEGMKGRVSAFITPIPRPSADRV